jgi:hypothetical protein
LRNYDQTVGVARSYIIALVDLTQSDAAVQWRQDMAILQIYLGGFDQPLVSFNRALVLCDQGNLRVERLMRYGILRRQVLIANQIDLSTFQEGFVARKLPLGLRQGSFVGP